ncbi:hypothetical protein NLI96_g2637 [Meripilus lineatus]|uniref:WD40 repeat-like protein n=1 Tax=Meripilus lineatus TaxID=2056292 RepID=A0AAD5YLQ0_9APHY|nr:hypothetical protein NLI96_g2637 [Physisporinus lineatus]
MFSQYLGPFPCMLDIGLLALSTATHSTLLAVPGHQVGHVQIIHLPPCVAPEPLGPPPPVPPKPAPPPTTQHPISIIAAHTTALTTLAVPPSGRLLATTSTRGTLVRIWDSSTGKLIRELRRGTDKAEIYGVAFRPDEREVCVWSDKGTVHVFSVIGATGSSNRQSKISPLTPYIPLPKYFDSEWSYAQYRIPTQSAHISLSAPPSKPPTADVVDEEKCVVGWIQGPPDDQETNKPLTSEYQLIALTYTGGWYRLSLPSPKSPASTSSGRTSPLTTGQISTSPPSVRAISMHRPRSSSGSSFSSNVEKGKERERDREGKDGRDYFVERWFGANHDIQGESTTGNPANQESKSSTSSLAQVDQYSTQLSSILVGRFVDPVPQKSRRESNLNPGHPIMHDRYQ